MIKEAMEKLKGMYIVEHFKAKNAENKEYAKFTKEELLLFCIELLEESEKE